MRIGRRNQPTWNVKLQVVNSIDNFCLARLNGQPGEGAPPIRRRRLNGLGPPIPRRKSNGLGLGLGLGLGNDAEVPTDLAWHLGVFVGDTSLV